MTDWWLDHGDVRIAHGDAVEVLRTMDEASVQCIVTSPPFWALRDYGTATWVGGDEGCEHVVVNGVRTAWANAVRGPNSGGKNEKYRNDTKETGGECGKCGARRVDYQIGLEGTPEEWVASLVAVFRECRRVLRPDGVMWVEVGDTYNAFNGNRGPSQSLSHRADPGRNHHTTGLSAPGLKSKDLVGAPWMLAFALRADGWYLRSDTIWERPNPMPESVTDRPTKAHSYVFLMTKGPRYFYDADAIRDPTLQPLGDAIATGQHKVHDPRGNGASQKTTLGSNQGAAGRNARSVWKITTESTTFAHFATMPQALAEKCIKAGTSERGACVTCGAPWERQVAKGQPELRAWSLKGAGNYEMASGGIVARTLETGSTLKHVVPRSTIGWYPTCRCYDARLEALPRPSKRRKAEQRDAWPGRMLRLRRRPGNEDWPTTPSVVLDPFMGSGTTALVARRLGRHAVGVDLSEEYLAIASLRLQQLSLFG